MFLTLVCVALHVRTYAYKCVRVCVRACAHTCICVYVYVCVCVCECKVISESFPEILERDILSVHAFHG